MISQKKLMTILQLEPLAHELLDVIGPRLVGTPQMKQAHDWAVAKYQILGYLLREMKNGVNGVDGNAVSHILIC